MKKSIVLFCLIWSIPQTAWANQPPGPNVLLAELLIPLITIFLTALGGGYTILKQKGNGIPGKYLMAICWIFFSMMHEGYATLGALIFGSFAIKRGITMLYWGYALWQSHKKQEKRANFKESIAIIRLTMMGLLLFAISLFLGGMAVAFVTYWPTIGALTHF